MRKTPRRLAVWESARDFFNGGADQFCWNHGVDATRQAAAAFSAVGGIENGELLARLADALPDPEEPLPGFDDQ